MPLCVCESQAAGAPVGRGGAWQCSCGSNSFGVQCPRLAASRTPCAPGKKLLKILKLKSLKITDEIFFPLSSTTKIRNYNQRYGIEVFVLADHKKVVSVTLSLRGACGPHPARSAGSLPLCCFCPADTASDAVLPRRLHPFGATLPYPTPSPRRRSSMEADPTGWERWLPALCLPRRRNSMTLLTRVK